MKKILITGNLGYIGPVLTSHLLKHGNYEIHGYDLGWFEYCSPHNILEARPFKHIYKDIRDISADDLDGIDGVIHLCAVSNDPMGKEFESATYEINLDASINLAKLCKASSVENLVFASSCSVYGAGGELPKKEEDTVNPLTAYAKSKISFEEALKEINSNNEMCITALRFSTACGPSPRIRLDLVLNDFVASALVNKKIDILSDGSPLRPLIDVEDMSRAMSWALQRKFSTDDATLIINIGRNDNNLTVLEMANLVKDALPGVVLSVNEDAVIDKRSYAVDFSLFKELSGDFYPKFKIEDSIVRLIDQLNPIKNRLNDFRDSNLVRHNTLRELKSLNILDSNLRLK